MLNTTFGLFGYWQSLLARNARLARRFVAAAIVLTTVLMVVLRLMALDSDAYPRLSWSSALLTDEGFYLHNARNVVLFHRFSTDQFNNALIMPLLHVVQLGWFQMLGVSAISARLLSVAFSLATLLLFFAALRRAFDVRVAWTATVLLGLDHVNLLYNRLALMDTPAAFWMVAAFYAFVCAVRAQTEKGRNGIWLACGVLLVAVYATRGVAAFLLPVPFLLLFRQAYQTGGAERRRSLTGLAALAGGLAVALAVYVAFWYGPHRAEIARVNHYYMLYQVVPQNKADFWRNIRVAFTGNRGLVLYLLKHTPVTLFLAIMGCYAVLRKQTIQPLAANASFCTPHSSLLTSHFLCLWLAFGMGVMIPISYAPSRYYVLFYPALMGLAALGIDSIARQIAGNQKNRAGERLAKLGWVAAMLVWFVWNAGWTGDWLLHLTYRQQNADRWLAQNLPPDSVLFGATAAGLCLNNHFRTVHVQEALCNDVRPLERFAPAPRYVLILDDRWKEGWWLRTYPAIVRPGNRRHTFSHILRPYFVIGLYPVPASPEK